MTQASHSGEQEAYYDTDEQSSKSDSETTARKIIQRAEMRFQVEDLKKSTKQIEALTDRYKGFISGMNQTNATYSINNSLLIRIPSEKLKAFISEIEKESIHTNYTRINSTDVTEEYLDITTRLVTKKEVRDRYIEILRNKAKTVKDVLDAEEKIRIIQEEIESIEGRLKYLDSKTAMSTINVEIYQKVEYVKSPQVFEKPFITKVKEGFLDGWELIQQLVIGLITIWPILLIILLLFVIRKKIARKIYK